MATSATQLAKRVKLGNELEKYRTEINSAVAILKQLRTTLANVRDMVTADVDYITEDTSDVQNVIDYADAEITTI